MSNDVIFAAGMVHGAIILVGSYLFARYLERKRK